MKAEERIMGFLGNIVVKYHKIIPFIAGALIVLSILAAMNLELKTELKDMMPENNPKIKMYTELDELFSGGSMIMITFEGTDKAAMATAAERFASEVRNSESLMKNIRSINLKMDRSFIREWGLLLQKAEDLEKTEDSFRELNLLPFITSLNDSFEETYTGEEAEEEIDTRKQENEAVGMLNQLQTFFTLLREYISEPAGNDDTLEREGNILAESFLYGDEYGFNYDNTMLMFTISPDFNAIEIEKIKEMMSEIKAIRKTVQMDFPGLAVGYTGDIAVQGDEQDALSMDMTVPAYVALLLILVLFIFSFKQIRAILFVVISLVIGIIFSFGVLGVTIGVVNILTSMMSVLLIGLGVDYGIQIIANFNTYRADGLDSKDAITSTFRKAGLGIILAALTTAIGFFVLAATGTKAFAQFGIVMGIGIIMCLIAMIFILPSLLLWFGKKKEFEKTKIPKIDFDFLGSIGKSIFKHRWTALAVSLILTAGFVLSAVFLNEYEYDILKLEPQDMQSIVQYRKIIDKYDINPFASMYIAESIEEARELTEKLEDEKLVAEVSSISQLIPPADELEERLAAVREIRNMGKRYTDFTFTSDTVDAFIEQLDRLEDNVIEIGQLSVAGLGEENKIVKKRDRMIREILGAEVGEPGDEVFQKLIALLREDKTKAAERLTAIDGFFAEAMDSLVSEMADIPADTTQQDILNALPEEYKKGFFDKSGTKNLITIYPGQKLFENLKNMERFNDRMARISPKITGTVQISIEWMKEFNEATPKAMLFIFLAVLLFLVLTFRNLKYTIFASIPLVVGMIWMLGMYPLFGFKLNMVNVLVIPLIIGMGIDFGIHIAHRYMMEEDIETTYRYTGKGVLLSALTTMIGFGSLGLIGNFPSISTMGSILFFGITACLLTTLIILPALLSFIKTKHPSGRGPARPAVTAKNTKT
ncbi:MAG: MMPL family transporter [Spirochaetales bacterium]|nr:MMPL family transporter [Spirochaetales bacterium]